MTRVKRLFKESVWVILGQLGPIVGALLLLRELTGLLSPNEYGNLTIALTLGAVVTQVIMGGLVSGITRYYSIAAEKNDLFCYVGSAKKILGLAAFFVLVVVSIVSIFIFFTAYKSLLLIGLLSIIFFLVNGVNLAFNGLQNASRNRRIVAFHQTFDSFFKVLLVIIFCKLFALSSVQILLLFLISSTVVLFSQLFFLRGIRESGPSLESNSTNYWIREIWRYGLPFAGWGLFSWVQQSSDRWAIEYFGSSYEVGYYSVLFQLGYAPMAILTTIGVNFLTPILFGIAGDNSDSVRKKNVERIGLQATTLSLLFTFAMFIVSFALHSWVFKMLVFNEYRSYSYLLPWFVLAGGIFSSGEVISLRLMSELKTSKMFVIKVATSIIGALMNVFCAYYAGMRGVVFALTVFSTIYFICMFLVGVINKPRKIQ